MILKGRVFDGIEMHEFAEMSVNESSGIIEYVDVGRPTSGKSSGDKGGDLTYLPGFIDTHIHFFGTGTFSLNDWVMTPEVTATINSVNDARNLLDSGFTTVRTMGDKVSIGMSRAEACGILVSPRIISAGFSIAETGGNDDPRNLPIDFAQRISYSYYCDGPWECRKAVRRNIREGARSIKAYSSGSFAGGGKIKTEFTVEELSAIAEETRAAGLKSSSHAYGREAISNSLQAGFDSIEHGLGLTEDLAEQMRRDGTYYVPTLSVYKRRRSDETSPMAALVRKHLSDDVSMAVRSGVKIAAGTDFVGSREEPHGENAKEMIYLAETIGSEAALRAGTSEAAKCVGMEDIGLLKKGKVADIIAVKGDPVKQIESIRNDRIRFVMKGGKIHLTMN